MTASEDHYDLLAGVNVIHEKSLTKRASHGQL